MLDINDDPFIFSPEFYLFTFPELSSIGSN